MSGGDWRAAAALLLGRLRRGGHSVVMVVVVMMMMVVVVVMMVVMVMVMHLMGHRSGGGRFLRDGVAGKADGEGGGDDKALDHGRTVLSRKTPAVFNLQTAASCMNSR
jgi:hypothetical protein